MSTGARFPAKSDVPRLRVLERTRLSQLVERAWRVPLTVVAAPAGAGKTSLLAGFATAERVDGRRVLWYQADRTAVDEAGFVAHLGQVLGVSGESLGALLAGLAGYSGAPMVLVIDDGHVLDATAAEGALEQLVAHLPERLHLVVGTRRPVGFDVSRLRMLDQLVEIGPDELRFRSWEVEDLFRRHHGQRLSPEEVADLARRTGGWAAGLHLFHLAVKDKPPAVRRAVLGSLPNRWRNSREYLTRNVLADLEEDLRRFLVDASVLGLVSGPWCDQLLGRSDSALVLAELAGRHLFLTTADDVTYRVHEVLRSHLEQLLFERRGEAGARAHCLRAAVILEEAGALSDAWRAYCRAQDWESAQRLLGRSAGQVLDATDAWLARVPAELGDHDGWMLLGLARRQVVAGRWRDAVSTYRRAGELAEGSVLERTARSERLALEGWVDPGATPPLGWSGALRQAVGAHPLVAVSGLAAGGDSGTGLVAAVGFLLAGAPSRVWELFGGGDGWGAAGWSVGGWAGSVAGSAGSVAGSAGSVAGSAGSVAGSAGSMAGRWPPLVAGLSVWLGGVAGWMLGRPGGQEMIAAAAGELEASVPPWLARLLQAVGRGDGGELAAAVEAASDAVVECENPWLESVVALIGGLALLLGAGMESSRRAGAGLADGAGAGLADGAGAELAERAGEALERAGEAAGRVGAAVLAAWSASLALLARRSRPSPSREAAAVAVQAARAAGCQGALAVARLVQAGWGGEALTAGEVAALSADDLAVWARLVAAAMAASEAAEVPPDGGDEVGPVTMEAAPRIDVACLGTLRLQIDGVPANLERLQPKVRALLCVLAADAGKTVHRDQLIAALWPDEDRSATRNLQVAVSSLRKYFDAEQAGAGTAVARRGEGYALELGPGQADVSRFEDAIRRGRMGVAGGDPDAAAAEFTAALELYGEDLLIDEGSPDWLVAERERLRLMATDAAEGLATYRLESGDPSGALDAAGRGLRLDRYRDRLWRAVVAAHEQAGDRAAAGRATVEYEAVLAELGVTRAAG